MSGRWLIGSKAVIVGSQVKLIHHEVKLIGSEVVLIGSEVVLIGSEAIAVNYLIANLNETFLISTFLVDDVKFLIGCLDFSFKTKDQLIFFALFLALLSNLKLSMRTSFLSISIKYVFPFT